MRILHLLSQTELTGAEVYAQNLVTLQKSRGHEVFVISDQIHVLLPVPWVSKSLSVNRWSVRRENTRFVRQFLLEHKIDVVHCHSRASVRIAHSARSGLAIAQVSTIHGRQHLSWGKRLVDSYGEYKILVCENLQHQFEKQLRARPGSLRVLRNPFAIPNKPSLRKTESKEKRIAFVGRSSGPKGERLKKLCLQHGFFDLLKSHPEWHFDIIASNPNNFGSEFLETLKTWPNPAQIQILSEIKDLSSRYQNYDLILGAGRVAVEALLQGCAVISFGEYSSHGLVRQENLPDCLESNFGDMGLYDHEGPHNADRILEDLKSHLAAQNQPVSETLWNQIASEFDEQIIYEGVLETYKAALFKRNVRQNIPILMYHKIPDESLETKHRIFVIKNNFEKHLRFFQSSGFSSLSFSELNDFWNLQRSYQTFPKKPLVLTFDDGYRDNLTNALPLLEKYQMKATVFLLSDKNILENTWDSDPNETSSKLLNQQERQQLAQSKMIEIGSHGVDHTRLTGLSSNDVFHQLHQSKVLLESEFHRPICCLAYPFGAVDSRIPPLAGQAGYDFAVNTDQGALYFADNPRSLFRVNIFPEENRFSLWKKTSSWYRLRFYRKHGK